MNEKPSPLPTATHLLRAEIERFLASPVPEVICIRGHWGVGKTFAWNKFLEQAKVRKGGIALQSYSYVSLFGIQNLDELRYAIFENTIDAKDIGTEPTLDSLASNTKAVAKRIGRHSLGYLSFVPFIKNANDAIRSASFLTVRKRIICIDDLERKGMQLRTQDVMGLISFLRERRDCKIVLILNDRELDDKEREHLDRYQEKVIDASLLFAPSPKDCVDIAFPSPNQIQSELIKCCVGLGLSNIRIMKKIERLVLQVRPILNSFDQAILLQAITTLAVFGFGHFNRTTDQDTSFIDFALSRIRKLISSTTTKFTEQESQWTVKLDAVNFTGADDFDLALLDGVRNGFFDEEHVRNCAETLQKQHNALTANQSLEAAWDLYHNSFDDNEDELVDAINTSVKANIKYVTPAALSSAMGLLKDLEYHGLAKELLEHFMKEHSDNSSFYDINDHRMNEEIKDPDLRAALSKKVAARNIQLDPQEILVRIFKNQSWKRADLERLDQMTSSDFKLLFKSLKGDELRYCIWGCLEFERISNRGSEYDRILENTKLALREIATESDVNRRRIRKYIPDEPEAVAETD